ncbi:MAG: hypothetical protein FWC83_02695 [Alphaproteobacteria bacterium]|nr:hypothetical protein [Alphaproteobacteria bacterium]
MPKIFGGFVRETAKKKKHMRQNEPHSVICMHKVAGDSHPGTLTKSPYHLFLSCDFHAKAYIEEQGGVGDVCDYGTELESLAMGGVKCPAQMLVPKSGHKKLARRVRRKFKLLSKLWWDAERTEAPYYKKELSKIESSINKMIANLSGFHTDSYVLCKAKTRAVLNHGKNLNQISTNTLCDDFNRLPKVMSFTKINPCEFKKGCGNRLLAYTKQLSENKENLVLRCAARCHE